MRRTPGESEQRDGRGCTSPARHRFVPTASGTTAFAPADPEAVRTSSSGDAMCAPGQWTEYDVSIPVTPVGVAVHGAFLSAGT